MKNRLSYFGFGLLISGSVLAQSTPESQSIQNSLNEVSGLQSSHVASMVSFSHKEDTKGSRYLFTSWVKGSVTGMNDVTIHSDSLRFNYDKMTRSLYMTSDMKTMLEIDKDHIKAFTLNGNGGDLISSYIKINAIDPDAFFQPIAGADSKYYAYKTTKTKFQKADYHTDGLVETGKNYDEYVDENEYYFRLPGGAYKKFELKKKSIKEVLAGDATKVNGYLSEHKFDDINEDFIKGLINYLNI